MQEPKRLFPSQRRRAIEAATLIKNAQNALSSVIYLSTIITPQCHRVLMS